jgi:hypothetical protein
MDRFARVASMVAMAGLLAAQQPPPVISRDAVSIHLVERGNMPLYESAEGAVTSIDPPRVAVNFSGTGTGRCEPGRSARVVVEAAQAIPGKVLQRSAEGPAGACEIELARPMTPGVGIGQRAGSLVEVDALKDVVFFGRPAGSQADTTTTLFVIQPGGMFARRVTVRYGKLSGPFIQVLEGLAPGDRVIVTEMSRWTGFPRLALR